MKTKAKIFLFSFLFCTFLESFGINYPVNLETKKAAEKRLRKNKQIMVAGGLGLSGVIIWLLFLLERAKKGVEEVEVENLSLRLQRLKSHSSLEETPEELVFDLLKVNETKIKMDDELAKRLHENISLNTKLSIKEFVKGCSLKHIGYFSGHTDGVMSVHFSPDGNLLASGSNDKTVRLWEVSTGKTIKTLQGHTDKVIGVHFSPDGNLLASGSNDHTVRLWEVKTGKNIQTLKGHTSDVYSVAFSPDGKLLASGSFDKTVRLWEVKTGKNIQTLKGHIISVYSVAFSLDGKLLASGSNDHTVRLWEVSTGKNIQLLKGHTSGVYSVAFSPDGKLLASGSGDENVCIWEVVGGKKLHVLEGGMHRVTALRFVDNQYLVAGYANGTFWIWDVSEGVKSNELKSEKEDILQFLTLGPSGLMAYGLSKPQGSKIGIMCLKEGKENDDEKEHE